MFTLAGDRGSRLLLEVEGERVEFTLGEALERSRVIPLLDEARAAILDQFGIVADEMDNPDSPYHNARKVKIHRAVPEAGYTVRTAFRDDPPPGRSWYYLRISQTNGQMAWTSPIWVER